MNFLAGFVYIHYIYGLRQGAAVNIVFKTNGRNKRNRNKRKRKYVKGERRAGG